MKQQVYEQIVEILREITTIEREITVDLDLQKDLGLDSAELMALAAEIENHWQLFLDEDIENPPQTINDLVALIEERLRTKDIGGIDGQ